MVKVTLIMPPLAQGPEPNLGILLLAAVIEKRGDNVSVIDLNYELKKNPKITSTQIISMIKKTSPEVLGFTAWSDNLYFVLGLARELKKTLKVPFLLGGPHPTHAAKQIIDVFKSIDVVIKHEGEETIVELMEYIEGKKELKNIKGIVFQEEGGAHQTPARSLIANLDKLPIPAYHLVPAHKEYFNLRNKDNPKKDRLNLGGKMFTSRGCPFGCTYCDTSVMWQKKYRKMSPKRIIDEMLYLKKLGVEAVIFSDDEFTLDKDHVKKFCALVKKTGMTWGCLARVDTVDGPLLQLMKDSGCTDIFFGIESGSDKILKSVNKGFTVKQAVESVTLARKVGISVFCSFMTGFPGETLEDMKETIRMAAYSAKLGCTMQCCLMVPYPGTKMLEENKDKLLLNTSLKTLIINDELEKAFGSDKKEWAEKFPQIFPNYYYLESVLYRDEYRKCADYINIHLPKKVKDKMAAKQLNFSMNVSTS